jgi:RNA polymerase sigma factor (sigma-70 family)
MGEAMKDERFDAAPGGAPDSAPTPSTMALARLAATGDSAATGKLLRALAPRLHRVVRAVLGGTHPDLDDALQQSLIGFVHALPAFRGDCDPLGYATIIAVRTAVNARKRAHVEHARRGDPVEADSMPGYRSSPSEEVDAQRRKDLLRDLLADLPSEQAEALAMRVVLGWSLKEIAVYGSVPLNTVRSRLRLAKEALRRRIELAPHLANALEVPS